MRLWQDLVSAALIGTERQSLTIPKIDGQLGKILHQLDDSDRTGSLLGAAAAIAIYQKAGKLSPSDNQSLPEPCIQEDIPCCSYLSAQHLTRMLHGEHHQVLPEWLALAAKLGKRVPPQCLPELLSLGKRQIHLREMILPVLGKRGLWLAQQNQEWNYALNENTELDFKKANCDTKQAIIKQLRQQNPEQGRKKLEETWQINKVDENISCLQALTTGLSLNDEPFLNSALKHKRKAIRDTAAQLLARIPASQLCQRMTQRVLPLIKYQPFLQEPNTPSPNQVEVTLPTSCTPDMIDDGIDQSQYNSAFGEKGSLLLQMLACTPPSIWNQTWNQSTEVIITTVEDSEWNHLLIEGWAKATINCRDTSWAQALLPVLSSFYYTYFQNREQIISQLLAVLTPNRIDTLLLEIWEYYADQAFNSQHPVVRLLSHSTHYWGGELSNFVLSKIQENMQDNHWQHDWQLKNHIQNFALYMEPALADQAIATLLPLSQGSWQETIDNFLARLLFRWQMIQAINLETE